ncbi:hypothetical protein HOY82DRAFT_493409, partial [Tuber indicum]
NLILRDIIKESTSLKALIVKATTIIHWVNNYSIAHTHLHDVQKDSLISSRPLRLLTGVITRWTSTYYSCTWLENLGPYLESLTFGHIKERFIAAAGSTRSDQDKAQEIVTLICNNDFWTALKENNQHLRPLVITNMILHRDSLHLDYVCLMFGYLYKYYHELKENKSIMIAVSYFLNFKF